MKFYHTKNFFSQLFESQSWKTKLFVGQLVTVNYYTDRRVGQIVKVCNPKKIIIKQNMTILLDWYKSDYEIKLNEFIGEEQIFTLRKNNRWVLQNESMHNGLGLTIGKHNHYIDPHF